MPENPFETNRDRTLQGFLGQYYQGRVFKQKYQLVKRIGEGGMGVVWQANYLGEPGTETFGQNHGSVALKFFKPEFLETQAPAARREAKTTSKLEHANIIRTYRFEEEGDEAAMVMEYVPGANLSLLLSHKEYFDDPEQILPWIEQLCDALEHAHSQGSRRSFTAM